MVKKIDDYVDEVAEMFPELKKSEVKRIITYGWKMVLFYVRRKNDILIKNRDFFCFFGRLYKDSLINFENYCLKLAARIRFMFQRTNSTWDGYFYFTRTENLYQEYLAQSKKKYKVFKKVLMFRLIDEASLNGHAAPYIFRIPGNIFANRMTRYYPELRTDKAELIEQRDSLAMEDILTSTHKYKYIK